MIEDVELFPRAELENALHTHFNLRYYSEYRMFRMHSAIANSRCELLELTKEDQHKVIKINMPEAAGPLRSDPEPRRLSGTLTLGGDANAQA